jgi:hypothetical protein
MARNSFFLLVGAVFSIKKSAKRLRRPSSKATVERIVDYNTVSIVPAFFLNFGWYGLNSSNMNT